MEGKAKTGAMIKTNGECWIGYQKTEIHNIVL